MLTAGGVVVVALQIKGVEMTAIYFINNRTKQSIGFDAPGKQDGWPVPRIGDELEVRGNLLDLSGKVTEVFWYYSVSNPGPVVRVHVDPN